MANRTIRWTVAEDCMSLTPTRTQNGGVQGDNNVTRAEFILPATLLDGYTLYIEYVDATGGYDKTEPLTPADGKVGVLLPLAWTQYGGEGALRLVAAKIDGETDTETGYTLEGRVRYHSRSKVVATVDRLIQGCIQALIDTVRKASKTAEEAAANADEAAETAQQSAQSADVAKTAALEATDDANAAAANADSSAQAAAEAAALANGSVPSIRDGEWYIGETGTGVPVTGPQGEKGDRGEKGDKGDTGAQGFSGVYVGNGEMPDGYNVQIDPDGEIITPGDIIGMSTPDDGEIFNDYENNEGNAEFSHAEGSVTRAGARAFRIIGCDTVNKTFTLDSTEGISQWWTYSCYMARDFENFGKVSEIINDTTIAVDTIPTTGTIVEGSSYLWFATHSEVGTIGIGTGSHSEGISNKALQDGSHSEGRDNISNGKYSHTEGRGNTAHYGAHAEGQNNKAIGILSHAEGYETEANGANSHTEGTFTFTNGKDAHAEGNVTKAIGDNSHAEGYGNKASGVSSHAEGNQTTASGTASHSEGFLTTATGKYSHSEGQSTTASGESTHAEGKSTTASGNFAHAEGNGTIATGNNSHAEGYETEASGADGHAEGRNTKAVGNFSHAAGYGTQADGVAQTVVGMFNEPNSNSYFAVGNGNSESDRKNAFEVFKDGRAEIQTQGTTDNSVATKKYVDSVCAGGGGPTLITDNLTADNWTDYVSQYSQYPVLAASFVGYNEGGDTQFAGSILLAKNPIFTSYAGQSVIHLGSENTLGVVILQLPDSEYGDFILSSDTIKSWDHIAVYGL